MVVVEKEEEEVVEEEEVEEFFKHFLQKIGGGEHQKANTALSSRCKNFGPATHHCGSCLPALAALPLHHAHILLNDSEAPLV